MKIVDSKSKEIQEVEEIVETTKPVPMGARFLVVDPIEQPPTIKLTEEARINWEQSQMDKLKKLTVVAVGDCNSIKVGDVIQISKHAFQNCERVGHKMEYFLFNERDVICKYE